MLKPVGDGVGVGSVSVGVSGIERKDNMIKSEVGEEIRDDVGAGSEDIPCSDLLNIEVDHGGCDTLDRGDGRERRVFNNWVGVGDRRGRRSVGAGRNAEHEINGFEIFVGREGLVHNVVGVLDELG